MLMVWVTLGVAAALWWPARADPERRAWALVTAALLLALQGAWLLGAWVWAHMGLAALAGNSSTGSGAGVAGAAVGALVAATVTGLLMGALGRRLGLSGSAFGWTWRQRPGSLGPALGVSALVLAIHAWTLPDDGPQGLAVSAALGWYQASLPGLTEELMFRGLLLALALRACPPATPASRIWGQAPGWGGWVLTAAFIALHGPEPARMLAVLPVAVLALWLRLYTGSLLLPVLVHNAWNAVLVAAVR